MPGRVLDLFVEFRNLTSGLPVPAGNSLLGALAYFGIDGLDVAEKAGMRQLAMQGGPYTADERLALLDYCQSDVDALTKLLPAMLPHIDFARALLRGRYMIAAARMEWNGVPIDVEAFQRLRESWGLIKNRLIAEVDKGYGVFVPAGQRTIDPTSTLGAALLETSAEWGIDAYRLADAVDCVWQEEREATAELHTARKVARKATGLTTHRIDQLEDSGRDHTSVPNLDKQARELARAFPALGIGEGYNSENGYDDTDYAGCLWDVLRDRDEERKPKHHPAILRRAAELIHDSPITGPSADPMTFSGKLWEHYLIRANIPWPRLPSGALALDDDTFKEMARAYPDEVGPIRELRFSLSQMRLNELAVGYDCRNRTLLSVFRSKTGRNQPSNSKFIFGPSTWLRAFIKPGPCRAVAYLDWAQQELGIAAALSGDPRMCEAYRSGDFYITFAKMAGAVPANATKQSHGHIREQFKVVALGVRYGLSAEGLARKLDVAPCYGRYLLRMHQDTFQQLGVTGCPLFPK
jgi:hypothetical protein